jgi:Ca-activated chloride channel family protein
MEGKAIEDARAAAAALVESLSARDRLAIVVFDSKAEVLLPSTPVAELDERNLRTRIATMRAEGTTDMAQGLAAGVREVTQHLDPEGVNRVILLGDGVPNDEAPMAGIAQAAAAQGVSITALGLGPDYNETLMGKMAQVTGGKFQYVADSSKVGSFFKEEIGRLQRTYARDAWLELAGGPGVVLVDAIGQETQHDGAHLRVKVGDLAMGENMEIVVRARTSGAKEGQPVELLDAVLKFSEGVGGAQAERRAFVGLHATSDEKKLSLGRSPDVESAAARAAKAAETLEEIRRARESDVPHPASAAGAGVPRPAPDMVRRQHDEAMQVLQKH